MRTPFKIIRKDWKKDMDMEYLALIFDDRNAIEDLMSSHFRINDVPILLMP